MKTEELLGRIDGVRAAVIGDFCLDIYWIADMKRSELSRETPHFSLPVVEEKLSPGGAGNTACNIARLKPKKIVALGVTGCDWRSTKLRALLNEAEVDASGLVECPGRMTCTYAKPKRAGISDVVYEDPRIDFNNYTQLPERAEAQLLDNLAGTEFDVLCVCDQMPYGCITPRVREAICRLGHEGKLVIADSRDRIGEYRDVIVKPNEVEAVRSYGGTDYKKIIRRISRHTGRPAIITLGDKGCMVCENGCVTSVPPLPVSPPIDICGAGDTFLSGLACALAAGATITEAAGFANCASAVTIRKVGMTGTASREEILQCGYKFDKIAKANG